MVRCSVWVTRDQHGDYRAKLIGRQLRSVFGGLATGFASSIAALVTAMALAVYTTPTSQSCCPRDYTFPARHGGQLDVVIFLGFVTMTLVFLVAALVAGQSVSERPRVVAAAAG